MSAASYKIFGVLYLVCFTNARFAVNDYWAETFDASRNCLREEEMKEQKATEPNKCATGDSRGRLQAGSSGFSNERVNQAPL